MSGAVSLYTGRVTHARFQPRHSFQYTMFMVLLDLERLDEAFAGHWLWSARRPAIAWFRSKDHLGGSEQPLAEEARDRVEKALGRRPEGRVELLTHLRYFGFIFNPVTFFYLRDRSGRLDAVLAEVHNTPWNQTHDYVLDMREGPVHEVAKRFHVSPFLPMEQCYRWTMNDPGQGINVHMTNLEAGSPVFEARLDLQRRAFSTWSGFLTLVRYPLMTLVVVVAIYWQALKLRLRGARFYPHPNHQNLEDPT